MVYSHPLVLEHLDMLGGTEFDCRGLDVFQLSTCKRHFRDAALLEVFGRLDRDRTSPLGDPPPKASPLATFLVCVRGPVNALLRSHSALPGVETSAVVIELRPHRSSMRSRDHDLS